MTAAETKMEAPGQNGAAALVVAPKSHAIEMAVSGSVKLNGFAQVMEVAKVLADAPGFVPKTLLGKPYSVAAAILTGMELSMGPMESLRSIHVVDGKPTMSAELMLSRARRAGMKTRWIQKTATCAEIGITVPGQPEQSMSFTIEEAREAGLMGKDNWKKHTAAMLRARAASAGVRAICPEVLGASGVYESDSGELSDGVPSQQYIEAQVIPEARPQSAPRGDYVGDAPPVSLVTAREPDELLAYVRTKRPVWSTLKNGNRAECIAAVTAAAERVGADVREVLAAGGVGEA